MNKARLLFSIPILAILIVLLWFFLPDEKATPAPENYAVTYLDVGLSDADRQVWHHTTEGSETLPLSFFQALRDIETGRPFIEILPRFGFLPDPDNEHGLPVGWAAHQFNDQIVTASINCAACHTGEIEYNGNHLRIDGAPNLVDVEAFMKGFGRVDSSDVEEPSEGVSFCPQTHSSTASGG